MALHQDLREFIELLNSMEVEYVIVGAHALACHGYPRHTGDIHILVRVSESRTRERLAAPRISPIWVSWGRASASYDNAAFGAVNSITVC